MAMIKIMSLDVFEKEEGTLITIVAHDLTSTTFDISVEATPRAEEVWKIFWLILKKRR